MKMFPWEPGMDKGAISTVVIVGGGTAGWMAAAALARAFNGRLDIRLVESEEIGIVGVGEATIPTINTLNQFLGIDENEMMKATQGTFKLGIEFVDWYRRGERYTHQFGAFGRPLGVLPLYQYWLRRHLAGHGAGDRCGSLWDYSFNDRAARANRFARVDRVLDSPLEGLAYAFQFDAMLYARYLRRLCEKQGVQRTEGRIVGVQQRDDGFLTSVILQSGEVIAGDLFIDCSGFRGLLIEETLKTGYDDWSDLLPCDRAWAVPCRSSGPLTPYTRATARAHGWQWRIPLQHRTGNGYVFSSRFVDEAAVRAELLDNLEGEPLAEPRLLKFVTGRRKQAWVKNCVALGLASGFLEPLESTSIHLAQAGITRLLVMFPDKGFDPVEIAEYNRLSAREYETVRDFIILHYKATVRDDSPFWNNVRAQAVPDSLTRKMDYFRAHGRVLIELDDLFKEMSWVQVLLGQGVLPRAASPLTAVLDDQQIDDVLADIRGLIDAATARLPDHAEFIDRFCKAPS
jgi:tryptophan halogenase